MILVRSTPHIEATAEKVRTKYDLSDDKVDMKTFLARFYDAVLEPVNDAKLDFDAKVEKQSKNQKFKYNPNHRESELNFALAREFGHLVFNHQQDSTYNFYTYEANKFAVAFLMPEKRFIQFSTKNADENGGYYNVEEIASHFNVSYLNAEVRGSALGLW
jgi:Zn-dependent peptidase ImmA (M78 family)